MNILVIAEHDHASIQGVTRHAVMAAAQIVMFTDAQVHLVVIGHEAAQAAQAGAHIAGVAQVIHLGGAQHAHDGAQEVAAQLRKIAPDYNHILVAATPWGSLIAQHLSAQIGVTSICEIVSIESADTFVHATHAGCETATMMSKDGIKVLKVRTTCFEAAPANGGSATVLSLATVAPGRPGHLVPRADSYAADDEPVFCGYLGTLGCEGAVIAHEARPFDRGSPQSSRRSDLVRQTAVDGCRESWLRHDCPSHARAQPRE